MSRVEAPNCVTIFGGGISGLTAAHELVERGFRVQVWEPECDARFPEKGCDVGGLARTQWSRVHWPLPRELRRVTTPSTSWQVFPLDPDRPDLAGWRDWILARIPADDHEARITVEMRYSAAAGATTLSAAEEEDAPLQERAPETNHLKATRNVLKDY